MLTEGEQNRLIQDNIDLPQEIAARYRGRKSIPFEDLVQTGMVGLVTSARRWRQDGKFVAYAEKIIKFAIVDFIEAWEEYDPIDLNSEETEKLIYEWQNFLFALYENWEADPHSPESLLIKYEEIAKAPESLASAFIGLTPFERKLIAAYFIQEPRRPLEQIARDHRISYMRAGVCIHRALLKMREAIKNKRDKGNIVAFPARAVRENKPRPPKQSTVT